MGMPVHLNNRCTCVSWDLSRFVLKKKEIEILKKIKIILNKQHNTHQSERGRRRWTPLMLMFQVAQPPSRLPGSVPYVLEPKPVPNWFVYHTHHTTPLLPCQCQCVRVIANSFTTNSVASRGSIWSSTSQSQPQLQSQVLGAISPQQGQWSLSSNVKPRAQTHKRSAAPAYCSLVIHKQYAGECLCVSERSVYWVPKIYTDQQRVWLRFIWVSDWKIDMIHGICLAVPAKSSFPFPNSLLVFTQFF